VVKLEFFFIFLVIPALGIFTELLCVGRIRRLTKCYTLFFSFLALSQLVFPHPYGSDVLVVWQITGIAALLWILISNILIPFVSEASRPLPSGKRSFWSALWNSYPGNMLIGSGLFIISAIIDMGNSLFLHYAVSFSRYGLCAFVLAAAFMLARLYGKMSRELAEKSALLENAGNSAVAREAVYKAHDLTDREKEVARLMTEGLDNETIAARLLWRRCWGKKQRLEKTVVLLPGLLDSRK
jgi:hypothetical protein